MCTTGNLQIFHLTYKLVQIRQETSQTDGFLGIDPINSRSILPLLIVAAMNSETDKVRRGEVGIQWGRRKGAIGGVELPIEWRSN